MKHLPTCLVDDSYGPADEVARPASFHGGVFELVGDGTVGRESDSHGVTVTSVVAAAAAAAAPAGAHASTRRR